MHTQYGIFNMIIFKILKHEHYHYTKLNNRIIIIKVFALGIKLTQFILFIFFIHYIGKSVIF